MRKRMRRGLDLASVKEAFAGPGQDTRTWCSYATVADEIPVEFDPDYGPLVTVALQPNKTMQRCRVLSDVAGDGEADYYPFVAGDEVLVMLPEGSERADGVIIGRLNNSIDKFPIDNVAGQDPSTNSFGFRRTRAPMIHETSGPLMWRSSISGAFLSIDTKGTVTLRDGEGGALQMSADTFGYQGPGQTPELLFQLDITGHRMTLQAGDTLLTLSGSKASPQVNALATAGSFAVSTVANPAAEHVLTTEAFLNMLIQIFNQMSLKIATLGPLAALAPVFAFPLPLGLQGTIPPALGLSVSLGLDPIIASTIVGLFAASTQKPQGTPAFGQSKPGIGCPGFIAG